MKRRSIFQLPGNNLQSGSFQKAKSCPRRCCARTKPPSAEFLCCLCDPTADRTDPSPSLLALRLIPRRHHQSVDRPPGRNKRLQEQLATLSDGNQSKQTAAPPSSIGLSLCSNHS